MTESESVESGRKVSQQNAPRDAVYEQVVNHDENAVRQICTATKTNYAQQRLALDIEAVDVELKGTPHLGMGLCHS